MLKKVGDNGEKVDILGARAYARARGSFSGSVRKRHFGRYRRYLLDLLVPFGACTMRLFGWAGSPAWSVGERKARVRALNFASERTGLTPAWLRSPRREGRGGCVRVPSILGRVARRSGWRVTLKGANHE